MIWGFIVLLLHIQIQFLVKEKYIFYSLESALLLLNNEGIQLLR